MLATQKIIATLLLLTTGLLVIRNTISGMTHSENNAQPYNQTTCIKKHVVECPICHKQAPQEIPLEDIRLFMTHAIILENIIAYKYHYCECIDPICRTCLPLLLHKSHETQLPDYIYNPSKNNQYYQFFNGPLPLSRLRCFNYDYNPDKHQIVCLGVYAYNVALEQYEILPSISDAILDLINCHKSSPAPSNATLRIKNIVDRFMNGNINLLLKKQNGSPAPLSMSIFDLALERFEAAHNTHGLFKERSPEQKEFLLYDMLNYMLNDLSMRSGRHSCQLQAFQEVFGFAQTHQLSQRIKNLLLQYSTIDAIFAYKNALKAMYSDDPQEQSALRYLYDYIKREIQQRLGKTTENKETQTNTQNSTATQTASRRTQPNAPDCIIC